MSKVSPRTRANWSSFMKHYLDKTSDTYLNRHKSVKAIGRGVETLQGWYKQAEFLDFMEDKMLNSEIKKSEIKQALIESSVNIAKANIADCFMTDPVTKEMIPLPLNQIPAETQAAIQQMRIVRVRMPGDDGRMEYKDVLDIKLINKTDALRLLGEWVDIKGDEKRLNAVKKDQMLGLTINGAGALAEPKEITDARNQNDSTGEVQLHQETSRGTREAWVGE